MRSPAGAIPQPVNIPLNDDLYVTTSDYYCPIWIPFRIPGGYINDGASVPRLAWFVIRKDGLIRAGALCHDFICDHKGEFDAVLPDGRVVHVRMSWKQAASLFHQINLKSGLPQWKCNLAHEAVRIWGMGKDW